jgi:hypothetical protein
MYEMMRARSNAKLRPLPALLNTEYWTVASAKVVKFLKTFEDI